MQQYYRQATPEEISFYQERLYPLQDEVMKAAALYADKIYLTGGTALARFHFQHRLSEDLDFFVRTEERKLTPASQPVLRRRIHHLPLPERRALAKAM